MNSRENPGVPERRQAPAEQVPQLYTPAQAAEILAVKESWLRRKAGLRLIPCTFLGKHLRFSTTNLRDIAQAGDRTPPPRPTRLFRHR